MQTLRQLAGVIDFQARPGRGRYFLLLMFRMSLAKWAMKRFIQPSSFSQVRSYARAVKRRVSPVSSSKI
jgi:hypothetical protein